MFRSELAASAGLVAGGAGNPIAAERKTRSTKLGFAGAGSDVGAPLFPPRVTSSQYAISGWSRREQKALQAIAWLPEKAHDRPGRLPPIPGSLETLLT